MPCPHPLISFALSGTGIRKDTVIVLPKQQVHCPFAGRAVPGEAW
jgi:hypothetical protein